MALIQCRECGQMISDKAKSCPKCGCSVIKDTPKLICPECGIEISDNDDKCSNCGFPVSAFHKESGQLPVCPQCGYIFHNGIPNNCPICKLPSSQIITSNEKTIGNSEDGTTGANTEHMIKQAYSDDGIDWLYYVRRAIWLYVLFIFVLYYGASGDIDDFAQKYSQKHGYVYSDIRNFVEQETTFFPVPKTEYYYRDNYGKKEVIGSYSFWNYTVK